MPQVQPRIAIPGSEARHGEGGNWQTADQNGQISPTIVFRRPPRAGDMAQDLLSGAARRMSREEAAQFLRADPADLAAVRAFVHEYGLRIVSENAEARTLRVEGSLAQVGKAFGVDLQLRTDEHGKEYLSYQGPLTIPASLDGMVEAVLGLDQRPIARRGAGQ
jgi:kumamolisin